MCATRRAGQRWWPRRSSRFGGLHVLVNNAGVVVVATPETTTLEQFRFANAVMSEGVFLGCKAAIPVMNASGGGSIVNMSSVASHLGYPVFFAYSAAKGAVRAMTKAIAVHCQMQKYAIRCNSIHAGAIETPMVQKASDAARHEDERLRGHAVGARQAAGRRESGSVSGVGRIAVRQRHGDRHRQRADRFSSGATCAVLRRSGAGRRADLGHAERVPRRRSSSSRSRYDPQYFHMDPRAAKRRCSAGSWPPGSTRWRCGAGSIMRSPTTSRGSAASAGMTCASPRRCGQAIRCARTTAA